MFNLKKSAQSKSIEKHLRDSNKKNGLAVEDKPGNYDWLLGQKSRKNKDNTIPYNRQLVEGRAGTNKAVVEKALNQNPKLYLDKRNEKLQGSALKASDLMAEAYDQKKLREYREAKKPKRDTEFWDKYVGEQMMGPITKVVKNKQDTQLENHSSRFENLDKTMPIAESQQENTARNKKDDKVEKMVMASSTTADLLSDADSMLFHIYGTAAKEDRGLSDNEKQMEIDINSGKRRVIAQFFDEENDYRGDIGAHDTADAFDQQIQRQGLEPAPEPEDMYIEPSIYGHGFDLIELTVYPDSSVLAGQTTKNRMNEEPFETEEEAIVFAKKEYGVQPEVLETPLGLSENRVPDLPPSDFDPADAGERWYENY